MCCRLNFDEFGALIGSFFVTLQMYLKLAFTDKLVTSLSMATNMSCAYL